MTDYIAAPRRQAVTLSITDDEVFTACPTCDARYATDLGDKLYQEEILCDKCATELFFTVPEKPIKATSIVKAPEIADILATANVTDKFDTGMKVSEAIKRAEHWWETIGAKEMQAHKKRQKHSTAANTAGLGGSFASLNPDDPNFLPSGILHGHKWDDLNKQEKLSVTKIWHHTHVRIPDKIGNPEVEHAIPTDKRFIN